MEEEEGPVVSAVMEETQGMYSSLIALFKQEMGVMEDVVVMEEQAQGAMAERALISHSLGLRWPRPLIIKVKIHS